MHKIKWSLSSAKRTLFCGKLCITTRKSEDSNKNFIVDHKNKEQICNYVGTLPTRFIPLKSGYMGTEERREIGNKVSSFDYLQFHQMQLDIPVSTNTHKGTKQIYVPQNDKFEGYVQYPRPEIKSFQNQIAVETMSNTRRDLMKK